MKFEKDKYSDKKKITNNYLKIIDEMPNPFLLIKIDDTNLSVRTKNCLKHVKIYRIADLVIKTKKFVSKTPNLGIHSVNEIIVFLETLNLTLGMKFESWPPENFIKIYNFYDEFISEKIIQDQFKNSSFNRKEIYAKKKEIKIA